MFLFRIAGSRRNLEWKGQPTMQISGFQNGNSLFSELSASSTSQTAGSYGGHRNNFASDLRGLISSIQSGNTSDAQQYLTSIDKLVPSNANSNSPLSTFLSSVSSALSNNSISGAQAALTTFESQRGHGAANGAGATGSTAPAANSGGGTAGTLGQDVLSLFTAIGSGDLQGAQSAYDTVTSLLLGGSSGALTSAVATGSSSSSSTSAATPVAPTGSSSGGASFTSLLAQIGSALSTGDINTAQTALDGFLQSLSAGSLVGATA
jgi:hypothetical protein